MRYLVLLSLLVNVVLFAALFLLIQRLGGFRYAFHRFKQDQAGLYAHRKQLFERLPASKGAIIFLGDSQIEQGEWAEMLRNDSIPILNRGISGDQTYSLIQRMPEIVRHKPKTIYLEIGINDLLLHVPPLEIIRRYKEIVQHLRQEIPDSELYICSVMPINNHIKYMGIENESIVALNKELEQIARTYAVPFVDLSMSLKDASGDLATKFTEDGIHLNGDGYRMLQKTLFPE